MKPDSIRAKFGGDFIATPRTFLMGIDLRLASAMASRFSGRTVLETCTGGGFTTIALARTAAHVITIEIDPEVGVQARQNVQKAGLLEKVTFVDGDAMNEDLLAQCTPFDAAFLDPDWAVKNHRHVYRFRNSNTEPPADELFERVRAFTPNLALVLPPLVNSKELVALPPHELQSLFLDGSHELYCLFFGDLAAVAPGTTEYRVGA
jgi:SAM-dependent methyltransferase